MCFNKRLHIPYYENYWSESIGTSVPNAIHIFGYGGKGIRKILNLIDNVTDGAFYFLYNLRNWT